MILSHALSEIESHDFAAKLNVASSMRAFFAIAGNEPVVREMIEELSNSTESFEEILGHLNELSRLRIDRRYENPNDTALAILLWAIQFSNPNPGYVYTAAEFVDRAPQCWYARKLARLLLIPAQVASATLPTQGPSESAARMSGDTSISFTPTLGTVSWWYDLRPDGPGTNDHDVATLEVQF